MAKASTYNAQQVRDKALAIIKASPEGAKSSDIQVQIYGDTNSADEHRNRQARLGFALQTLRKAKLIQKAGGRLGSWTVHDGRPEPVVHDLPSNGARRGRPRGSKDVSANGSLRSYIIRDIKAKLTELEALDH